MSSTNCTLLCTALLLANCRDAFSRLRKPPGLRMRPSYVAILLAETQECVSTAFRRTHVKTPRNFGSAAMTGYERKLRFTGLMLDAKSGEETSSVSSTLLRASCRIRTNDPEITNHVLWPTELKRQVGKRFLSRRYNQVPLLRSHPGGFRGSWP